MVSTGELLGICSSRSLTIMGQSPAANVAGGYAHRHWRQGMHRARKQPITTNYGSLVAPNEILEPSIPPFSWNEVDPKFLTRSQTGEVPAVIYGRFEYFDIDVLTLSISRSCCRLLR